MRYATKYSLLAVLVLLVTGAHAQYNWTPSVSLADNTPYCAAINCLTSIGTLPSEIKAGADGTLYALEGNDLFTYVKGSGWVLAPASLQTAGGYPLAHISVGSKQQVLALSTIGGWNPNTFVLDAAGTGWTNVNTSAVPGMAYAEIGYDGTIWGRAFLVSTVIGLARRGQRYMGLNM
jgi:hypothetical protein